MCFRARAGGTTSSATANTSASSTWKVCHTGNTALAPDAVINILNVVMINHVLLIWPVSGSRYTASLRTNGADWGLDTRIIF